jgi:hypothetical protein
MLTDRTKILQQEIAELRAKLRSRETEILTLRSQVEFLRASNDALLTHATRVTEDAQSERFFRSSVAATEAVENYQQLSAEIQVNELEREWLEEGEEW